MATDPSLEKEDDPAAAAAAAARAAPAAETPPPGNVPAQAAAALLASIHDRFAKSTFSVTEHVASLARFALSPSLVGRLDLDRMTAVRGDFSDARLQERRTDLLFGVPVTEEDFAVYLLIEHLSRQLRSIALKLGGYLIQIWEQHLRTHPDDPRVPRVISLVLHHNREHHRWSPLQLAELLGPAPDPSDQGPQRLPAFEYQLLDLEACTLDELHDPRLTPLAQVTLVALKTANGNPDFPATLEPWLDQLLAIRNQPGGADELHRVLTYSSRVSDTPPEAKRALAARLGREVEEKYMTTFEIVEARSEARGFTRGEARGFTRGEASGEVKGNRKALVTVLTARFGTLPDDKAATVQAGTPDQLTTWLIRGATARSLDEVFA